MTTKQIKERVSKLISIHNMDTTYLTLTDLYIIYNTAFAEGKIEEFVKQAKDKI